MDLITPEALPADPLDALRELTRCEDALEKLRRDRTKAARAIGASWKQVGEVLGMTEQSAWEYFMRDARKAIARSDSEGRFPDRGWLTERPGGAIRGVLETCQ